MKLVLWGAGLFLLTMIFLSCMITGQQKYAEEIKKGGFTAVIPPPDTPKAERFGGYSSPVITPFPTGTPAPDYELTEEEQYPGITERRIAGLKILIVLFLLSVLYDILDAARRRFFPRPGIWIDPEPYEGGWKYLLLGYILLIIITPVDVDLAFE
jgi:hypothetical protein